jgi:hypothetical protein
MAKDALGNEISTTYVGTPVSGSPCTLHTSNGPVDATIISGVAVPNKR